VFHSFRHTFTDALRAAKIERDLKKALLGHSGGDVTDEYGEGFPVEVLNGELQKIVYHGLDLTRLGEVAKHYIDG
jgi:integrase